ncbi:MAG: MFS transporter [Candidatus Nezhaarchaeales archaeon]
MKFLALLTVCTSSFLVASSLSSVNVAVPSIADDLSMDAVTSSWVVTSFTLASAAFLVPLGRIADIRGRRATFLLGNALFVLASMLSGSLASSRALIFSRFVQGLGGAMIFATGVAILSSTFDRHERGRAIGLQSASVYTGLAIGPLIGGLLTEALGWRSVFFFNAPLGATVIALSIPMLKGEQDEALGEKFDFVGALLYVATIISIMLGLSESSIILSSLGVFLLLSFIFWELRAHYPILELKLFKNLMFALSNVVALLNYAATYAVSLILSLYLQYVKGLTPYQAGLVLTVQAAFQAILSPIAGSLSDRFEPRVIASAGMGIAAICLWCFSYITPATSILLVTLTLAFLGIGLAFFISPNTYAIMSSVESKFYGIASAMTATMRNLGQSLSLSIIALLLATYLGKGVVVSSANLTEFMECIKTAFRVFSALCVVGVGASLVRGKLR